GLTKTCTIRNSGTATWTSNYSLQFSSASGSSFCGHGTQTLSGTVAPGSNYVFSISCAAPTSSGTFQEFWSFIGPSGTINVSSSRSAERGEGKVSALREAATF